VNAIAIILTQNELGHYLGDFLQTHMVTLSASVTEENSYGYVTGLPDFFVQNTETVLAVK
jgi:hypothetical protein